MSICRLQDTLRHRQYLTQNVQHFVLLREISISIGCLQGILLSAPCFMQNPQSFLQQQRQSASPPPQAPAILGGYEPISYTSFMSQRPLYPAYLNISTLIQSHILQTSCPLSLC